MNIVLKRVYETPARSDGARILVDRLWPRGISKDTAQLTEWLKDLAPSNGLRKWFHARPTQWLAFRKRYLLELRAEEASAALERLYKIAATRKKVTLLFGSRNLERNNATVLKELLEGMRKPPTSSGPLRAVTSGRARARK
jgi:uncharacterized protein YeaO (DUF488 family)